MTAEQAHTLYALDCLQQLDLVIVSQHCRVRVEWFRAIDNPATYNRQWHAHSNCEIHFILKGSMHYDVQDRQFALNAGQALIIPANMPHRLEPLAHADILRYTLNVAIEPLGEDPEGLFMRNALAVEAPMRFTIDEAIASILETCLNEARDRISGFTMVIESNLLSLLTIIARTLSHSPQAAYRVREKQGMNKLRLQEILALIEQSATEPLTVYEIATRMHLSTKQVQRIVQAECGASVKQLMMRIRLQHAKELLKDANQSMTDIAIALGFTSEQSFCRFFQKLEGRTPGRYRSDMMPH